MTQPIVVTVGGVLVNRPLPHLLRCTVHMRVPLDLCCPVLFNKPPLAGSDLLTAYGADNRRRFPEPHRFLPRAMRHGHRVIGNTSAFMWAHDRCRGSVGCSAPASTQERTQVGRESPHR